MRLTKIGNSFGIRIPKPIIQQAGLDQHEFEMRVVENGLLLAPIKPSRAGWGRGGSKAGVKRVKMDQLLQGSK